MNIHKFKVESIQSSAAVIRVQTVIYDRTVTVAVGMGGAADVVSRTGRNTWNLVS